MSVSFNSNHTSKQSVSFQKNKDKSSYSYANSTIKGALIGGGVGAGVAAVTKSVLGNRITQDTVTLSKKANTTKSLLSKNLFGKFAIAGAVVGAASFITKTAKNKKIEESVNKLKLRS